MVKHTVLVVSLGVAMAACSVEHDCRPGTLFVRAPLDGDAGSADAIVVHVHRDGHDDVDLAPFVRRQSGAGVESFEIAFGTYEASASVTLDSRPPS